MKKKILVCFSENLEEHSDFQHFSKQLTEKGFEVHSFNGISSMQLQPHSVLAVLERVWGEQFEDNEYHFLSDMKIFFKLCYCVLQQTFEQFIFWGDGGADYGVEPDDIYLSLLNALPKENIGKKIFVSDPSVTFGDVTCDSKKEKLDCFFESTGYSGELQQNIYRFKGECYLLEPVFGDIRYINIDQEPVSAELKFADVIVPCELDSKLIAQTEEMLELVSRDQETTLRRQEVVYKLFSMLRATVLTSSKLEQRYYTSIISVIGEAFGVFSQVFALSFLLQIYKASAFHKKLLALCLQSRQLSIQNKYFILSQSCNVELCDRQEHKLELLQLETATFRNISKAFADISDDTLQKIDENDLQKDNILVLVSQFLNYSHDVTKYALNLCGFLLKKNGKKVTLLNTCEFLTPSGRVPFFDISQGIIMSEYANNNSVGYEGVLVPYGQMVMPMPNVSGINGVTELVAHIKPSLIINLSELSVAAEICSKQIKTIFMPLEKQIPAIPAGSYLLAQKGKIDKVEKKFYKENGVQVIESISNITVNNIENEDFWEEIFATINTSK